MSIANNIIIIILNIIPALIILSLILYSDRKSKEPLILMILCFLSGFLTTYMAISTQKLTMQTVEITKVLTVIKTDLLLKTIVLALIEECFKLLILHAIFSRTKSFDDIYDGFVYSSIIALSFAFVETMLYAFKEINIVDMSVITLTRTLTTLPLHITCGAIMGHFIALEKFSKTRARKLLEFFKALIVPTIIHSTYNILLIMIAFNFSDRNIMSISIIIASIILNILTFVFIKKDIFLNDKFIKNKKFPTKYQFLLNKKNSKKK